MKRVAQIKPVAFAMLLVFTLFPPAFGTPAPTPQRLPSYLGQIAGAFDYRVAVFSGFAVSSVRLYEKISPQFDLAISDSYQPTGGVTGNLLDVGIQYDFRLSNPKVLVSLGVGFASEYGPFPGFGFTNASGFSAGAGATIQLTDDLFGYASGSLVSLGGTSKSVVDFGLQQGFIELGYISFAGNGAPYLGLSIPLICLWGGC